MENGRFKNYDLIHTHGLFNSIYQFSYQFSQSVVDKINQSLCAFRRIIKIIPNKLRKWNVKKKEQKNKISFIFSCFFSKEIEKLMFQEDRGAGGGGGF